jgi:hypothetical protein
MMTITAYARSANLVNEKTFREGFFKPSPERCDLTFSGAIWCSVERFISQPSEETLKISRVRGAQCAVSDSDLEAT